MNALAALVGNAWGSNVISKMSTNVIHTNTSLSLYGAAGDLYEGTAALALAGSKTGVVSPAQVAAGISWSVTVGYRGGHPRSYIPGLVIPDTATVQTLSSIFASSLAAGANTYRTSVNGYTTAPFTSVELGTVSFVRAKAWRTPPVFIPFGSAHVDVRIDTLRNRLGPDLP